MRAGNPEVAARKPTARSRVSNGRDILAALVSDQGAADRMIVQLCRRFAALARTLILHQRPNPLHSPFLDQPPQ